MKRQTPNRLIIDNPPRGFRSARRGAISMVLVVGVMVIGTLLLTESVRTVLNERQALPRQFERQQAQLLLQDGITRLTALASFDDIKSGSWKFPKGIIHSDQSGILDVKLSDGQAIITARYPLESKTPVSLSRTLTAKDFL